MKKLLLLLLLPVLLLPLSALADGLYYINPDGGVRYHADPNCASISAKYLPLTCALTQTEAEEAGYRVCSFCYVDEEAGAVPDYGCFVLPEGDSHYHHYAACPLLTQADQQRLIPVDPLTLDPACSLCGCCGGYMPNGHWRPCYDEGTRRIRSMYACGSRSVSVTGPGVFTADADLPAGLYTVVSDAACAGTLVTCAADGREITRVDLTGGVSCSFLLGERMSVELPQGARLTPITRRPVPQVLPATLTFRHARLAVTCDLVGGYYLVSAIPGETGWLILSTAASELGDEAPVRVPLTDEPQLLRLDGLLVEVVNGVLTADDAIRNGGKEGIHP